MHIKNTFLPPTFPSIHPFPPSHQTHLLLSSSQSQDSPAQPFIHIITNQDLPSPTHSFTPSRLFVRSHAYTLDHNLIIYSICPSLSTISNTIWFPTISGCAIANFNVLFIAPPVPLIEFIVAIEFAPAP